MELKEIRSFARNWILPPALSALLIRLKGRGVSPSHILSESLTKQGEIIKDRHKGERCFLLGAGSSVKQQDLKKLIGENVISVSNTFVHPDFHLIKPKYHVLPPVLTSHSAYYSEAKFIEWLREMNEKTLYAEMFMHYGDKKMVDKNNLFKGRIVHWVEYCGWNEDFNTPIDLGQIPRIWSVSELAITLAVYMGFEKIYLVGFDHDWFNGPLVYFFDTQKDHKVQPTKEVLSFADSEFQMRRHAFIFKKYKYLYGIKKNIYNANADQNTYVDVFPKVPYESLFEK